jgi:uncharacterized membrane protein YqaE (UPF0057 family)
MARLAKVYKAAAYVISAGLIPFVGKLIDRGFWWMVVPFLLSCLMLAIGEGMERKYSKEVLG